MDIMSFLTNPTVRLVMVSVAYLAATVGFVTMIYHGFKYKTYGMPPLSTAAAFGFSIIVGFYGPWSDQKDLFPAESQQDFFILMWVWRVWALLMGIVLVQYMVWARNHKNIWSDLQKYYLPKFLSANVLFVIMVIVLTIGEWHFIVFYQDYYVNQISPIVVMFIAVGYLATLFLRPKLLGLSLIVAWAWAISNLLLYAAVVLGPMEDPYRNHDPELGYGFIYWLYAVTILLNFAYVYLLTRRRHELHAEFHEDASTQAPMEQAAFEYCEHCQHRH